jgi:hypothetical protein
MSTLFLFFLVLFSFKNKILPLISLEILKLVSEPQELPDSLSGIEGITEI